MIPKIENLTNEVKNAIIESTVFRQLIPIKDETTSHFHDVFSLIDFEGGRYVAGPKDCRPEEILRMITIALGIDESKFIKSKNIIEFVDVEIKTLVKENDVLTEMQPYIPSLKEIIETCIKDNKKSESREYSILQTELNATPIIGLNKLNELYEEEEYRNYDIDRLVTLSWTLNSSIRFKEQLPNLRVAVFPAFLIFELYLYKIVKRNYLDVFETRYQDSSDYIHCMPDFKTLRIRPDVSIYTFEGKPITIMDAKYKSYQRKQCYGDVRQMSTYIKHLGPAPGIIVYPKFLNTGYIKDAYYDEGSHIGFLFIDIMNDETSLNSYMDSIGVKKALTEVLEFQL